MSARRIAVVTSTRADYGLLQSVMRGIADEPALELQVVATGMHLSPEFGLTVRAIEADGFRVDARVEMLLSSDSPVGIAKSMGLGTIGFADAFERLRPDLVLYLGDRFEILAAAQAALVARIPAAHLAGGDTTEGAYDEQTRHALTKLSHLHFVTNEESARRVRQMGEDPANVHVVGSPGLDFLRTARLLDRAALERSLGFTLRPRNVLVTFHPTTLDATPPVEQFDALAHALAALGPDTGVILTRPNADGDGRALFGRIDALVAAHPNMRAYTSLGQLRYLSAMALCDAVVGNSSSGLYEAPSLGRPTVNIGDRQRGRLQAASVLDCAPEAGAIEATIRRAFTLSCDGVVNPYGDGHTAGRIVAALCALPDPRALLQKRFFLLP